MATSGFVTTTNLLHCIVAPALYSFDKTNTVASVELAAFRPRGCHLPGWQHFHQGAGDKTTTTYVLGGNHACPQVFSFPGSKWLISFLLLTRLLQANLAYKNVPPCLCQIVASTCQPPVPEAPSHPFCLISVCWTINPGQSAVKISRYYSAHQGQSVTEISRACN